jgi:hypothetical protein
MVVYDWNCTPKLADRSFTPWGRSGSSSALKNIHIGCISQTRWRLQLEGVQNTVITTNLPNGYQMGLSENEVPHSTSWFDTSSFSHCKWQWNMSRLASCHCLVISQDFTDWGDQGFWWSYFAINHQFWSIILWPHKTAVKSSMCHSCFVIGFYSSMIIYPNYLSIIKVCKNWGLLYHPFWPKLHQIDRWSCAQLSSSNAVSQRPQRPQALIPRLKTTEFLGLTMWRMFGWVS